MLLVLSANLMDQSKISAALPEARFSTDPYSAAEASTVVVDLANFADTLSTLHKTAPAARIVCFGSHVDRSALVNASEFGAHVFTRAQFFRDPAAAIGRV